MKEAWSAKRALLAVVLTAAVGLAGPGSAQQDGDAAAPVQMPMDEVEAAYTSGDFETARAGLAPHAEAGDPVAQYRLGFMMANGSGGPVDRAGAIGWLDKAAAQGHGAAPLLLAKTLISGQPEAPDLARAAELFQEAADENAEARFYLAQILRQGAGVDADPQRAFRLMEEAARDGLAVAQVNLSQMYARGEGVEADDAQAVRWLLEAADQGNHTAMMSLYTGYSEGKGLPKDPGKARHWLETAAKSGLPLAQRILGTELLMAEGEGADPARGISLLLKAAEAGEAGAQNNLGMAYATGLGVEADNAKALKYYQVAADQGLSRAALITGDFYTQGRGADADYEKAAHYYWIAHVGRLPKAGGRLGSLIAGGHLDKETVGKENTLYFVADAAQAGDPAALEMLKGIAAGGEEYADLRLGLIYRQGAGVEADADIAAAHLKTAAEAGYAEAQAELAALYAAGDGVEQNMIEAHKWANVAAANGSETGTERRDTYANLLTPEEIAEAQARARVYMKK